MNLVDTEWIKCVSEEGHRLIPQTPGISAKVSSKCSIFCVLVMAADRSTRCGRRPCSLDLRHSQPTAGPPTHLNEKMRTRVGRLQARSQYHANKPRPHQGKNVHNSSGDLLFRQNKARIHERGGARTRRRRKGAHFVVARTAAAVVVAASVPALAGDAAPGTTLPLVLTTLFRLALRRCCRAGVGRR